jgi:hypothetical protein
VTDGYFKYAYVNYIFNNQGPRKVFAKKRAVGGGLAEIDGHTDGVPSRHGCSAIALLRVSVFLVPRGGGVAPSELVLRRELRLHCPISKRSGSQASFGIRCKVRSLARWLVRSQQRSLARHSVVVTLGSLRLCDRSQPSANFRVGVVGAVRLTPST